MGLRINTNSDALSITRSLESTGANFAKSLQRLSTGLRVNTAADDASGFVIATKFKSQANGLAQGIKNSSDATNLVKTAQGSLGEIAKQLQSARTLVSAAATGSADSSAVATAQTSLRNAIDAINKFAKESQFGSKKLLDGNAGLLTSVKGTAVVTASIANVTEGVSFTDGAAISVGVTQAASKATVNLVDLGTDGTVIASSGSINVNGTNISYTANVDSASTMLDKINQQSDSTGVVATLNCGQITLTSKEYGSDEKITVTSSATTLVTGNSLFDAGTDIQVTVKEGATVAGGTDISDATWTAGKGLVAKDSRGNQITMDANQGNSVTSYDSQLTTTSGTLTFQLGAFAGQTSSLNINSAKADNLGKGVSSTFANLDATNVNTQTNATEALKVLDKAISDVAEQQAQLGSFQTNVLEATSAASSVAKENIESSVSTIMDTEMATEMVQFTKFQIMQSAGISMLSQANQASQGILSLLR